MSVNKCMSMLPVAFDRLRNTLQCLCPIKEISHDNGFIFQSLVILEEAFDFTHAMGRQCKNRGDYSAGYLLILKAPTVRAFLGKE